MLEEAPWQTLEELLEKNPVKMLLRNSETNFWENPARNLGKYPIQGNLT